MTTEEDRLEGLGRLLPEPLILLDGRGLVLDANVGARALFPARDGQPRGELLAELVDDPAEHVVRFLRACRGSPQLTMGALTIGAGSYRCEGAVLRPGSDARSTRLVLRLAPRKERSRGFKLLTDKVEALAREVESRRRAESLLTHQLRALEMIAKGEPLERILEEIVLITETHASAGVRASILLLDGDRLRLGAAPNLPDVYNRAIDGVVIGPQVGSCGTAVHDCRTVVVRDIASDPLWADYKHLALPHDLRACWSTPVFFRGGEPAGAFALYYDQVDPDVDADLTVVSILARITALALDSERDAAQLRALLASERETRAEAEAANRSRDEFLAVVSHELRNPLHAMLGWTAVLREPTLDDETRRTGIEALERNAKLQAQIVSELLDFSRIMAGKVQLERRPVALSEVLRDAVESLRPAAQEAELSLELDLGPPAAPIEADPGRLQQAITNLVSNAIKFTPARGTVHVGLEHGADVVRITVTDTGVGIEPDFLPHVFEVFRQADVTKARRSGGLGLGLSIVRSIAELHGGSVAAHSDGPDRGARFTLELPAVAATLLAEGVRDESGARLAGRHVLVVDDEPDARATLERALTRAGARVTVAESGASGLDACAAGCPDLLVSDIAMPVMDGHEFLRRLRHLPGGDVPALAITAHARERDRREAFEAGFNDFVAKPVDPAEVVQRLALMTARPAPG